MVIVVTSISSLVHLYSISYMSEDPHSPRFICYLSIPTFFYANGVGLASFLLIHLWFTRLQVDKATTKAMPINRVGDFGLAPGILGCFTLFQTIDFSTIFAYASGPRNSWISCNMRFNGITFIFILLFIVSTSIHAATMVTDGVFMIARCSPLFEYPPTALILMNHTFFKALLFLSAGSVIHAMLDVQDMRKMGGLASSFPFTYAMMLMESLCHTPILHHSERYVILELAYTKYSISGNFAFCLDVSLSFLLLITLFVHFFEHF
ncbi:hypothetical protein NE237_004883 [Protea cynaroides]|uniref:Uncharacterized protein n=1 Tax=Protea cynaroides TaxID=273540 RepID=A0A9Q0KKA3_9MAGN|nr:hypothetical protein NE237_004883 [Protea cynaroides]